MGYINKLYITNFWRHPFPVMWRHIHEFHHIITSSHFISLISSLYSSPLTLYSYKYTELSLFFRLIIYQQHCERHCRIPREKDLTELPPPGYNHSLNCHPTETLLLNSVSTGSWLLPYYGLLRSYLDHIRTIHQYCNSLFMVIIQIRIYQRDYENCYRWGKKNSWVNVGQKIYKL